MIKTTHYPWSHDAVIYEVNIRQYTQEGTFRAFMPHLDRIHEMGVNILWLMPIHPIGLVNRKGSLGSYYSVQDFTGVNPEFGSLDDLKVLVQKAHQLGMKVIIDWVANHSSWDNHWASSHPEYYKKTDQGEFLSPFDWTDAIALNYENPDLRLAMISAMKFWLKEANIDGFRCDVAGLVPVSFWNEARDALQQVKPLFMLAEDEENPELLKYAFDMNYTWKLHKQMIRIAKGEEGADRLKDALAWGNSLYPHAVYRMNFITNHDENSWNGSEYERFGNGVEAFAVLTFLIPGMPLIYSGQEAGLNKRLSFFDKDHIVWETVVHHQFYKELIAMKKELTPLHNGPFGAPVIFPTVDQPNQVLALVRKNHLSTLLAVFNLSNEHISQTTIHVGSYSGQYIDYHTGASVNVDSPYTVELPPWQYQVLVCYQS